MDCFQMRGGIAVQWWVSYFRLYPLFFQVMCQLAPFHPCQMVYDWEDFLKECGTKNSRGVCNGSPRMKGTVTLREINAASLDQTCDKICWTINAAKSNIVIGADASNAFAEAPSPTAPLYMKLDS